jgi:hypothetical protein
VLRFYLVYRAMVRAKVARFRMGQLQSAAEREQPQAEYRAFMDLARRHTQPSADRAHRHPRSGQALRQRRRAPNAIEQTGASAFAPTSSASDCTVSERVRPAARASERDSTPRHHSGDASSHVASSRARSSSWIHRGRGRRVPEALATRPVPQEPHPVCRS